MPVIRIDSVCMIIIRARLINFYIHRNINWSSPEVLNGKSAINQSADVWSLAFVITEIFTGDVPFDTEECRLMSIEHFKDMLEKGLRPSIPDNFVSKNPWFQRMVSDSVVSVKFTETCFDSVSLD